LNTVLHERFTSGDARYCTVVFGFLQPGSDRVDVHLASGSHPSALIQRADGTAHYALTGLLASFGDGLDDDTALLALGVPAPAPAADPAPGSED
ncbi:hypothetical protein ACFWAX_38915, partial [Streptomyces sp. NPDC059956]